MATPPKLPSGTPPASTEDHIKLLSFARETASEEIKSIERLHDKTLKSLGYSVLLLALAGGVIGWLGYDHLQKLAVGVARDQMEDTVKHEVADRMDKRHVDQAIQTVLGEKATDIINTKVGEGVRRLRPDIQKKAVNEAVRLVSEQRHLTAEQANKVRDASEPYRGRGFKVRVRPFSDVPEEMKYASEIEKALRNAGGRTSLDQAEGGFGGSAKLPALPGVFIAVDHPEWPPEGAAELQKVLKAAGLSTTLEEGERLVPWSEEGQPARAVPTLVVGSKF